MRLHDKYHKNTNETSIIKLKEHYCWVLQLHIREVPRADHRIILNDDLRGLSHSLQTDVCPFITYCAEIRRCIIRAPDSVVK